MVTVTFVLQINFILKLWGIMVLNECIWNEGDRFQKQLWFKTQGPGKPSQSSELVNHLCKVPPPIYRSFFCFSFVLLLQNGWPPLNFPIQFFKEKGIIPSELFLPLAEKFFVLNRFTGQQLLVIGLAQVLRKPDPTTVLRDKLRLVAELSRTANGSTQAQ